MSAWSIVISGRRFLHRIWTFWSASWKIKAQRYQHWFCDGLFAKLPTRCPHSLRLAPWRWCYLRKTFGAQSLECRGFTDNCRRNRQKHLHHFAAAFASCHPGVEKKRSILHQKNSSFDIDLTYITARGNWYYASWKGDESKSGGIATNIWHSLFLMCYFGFSDLSKKTLCMCKRTIAPPVIWSLKKPVSVGF